MNKLLKGAKKGKKSKKSKDSKKGKECKLFGAAEEKTTSKKDAGAFDSKQEDEDQIAIATAVTENKDKEVVKQDTKAWEEDWKDESIKIVEKKQEEEPKKKVVGWGNTIAKVKKQEQVLDMAYFPEVGENLEEIKKELHVDNKNTMIQNLNMNTKKTIAEAVNGGGFFGNAKKAGGFGGAGSGGGGLLKMGSGAQERLANLSKPLPPSSDITQRPSDSDPFGGMNKTSPKPAPIGLSRNNLSAKEMMQQQPAAPTDSFRNTRAPEVKLERGTGRITQDGDQQASIFGGNRRGNNAAPRDPPIVLERGTGRVEPQPVRGRFDDAPGMITRGGWNNGQKDESEGAVRTFKNSKKKGGTLLDGLKAKPGQVLTAPKKTEPAPAKKFGSGVTLERGTGKSFKLGEGEPTAFGGFGDKKKAPGAGAAKPKGRGFF